MGMCNARDEFVEHTRGKEIKCAMLHGDDWRYKDAPHFILPVGFSMEEQINFLNSIDIDYDAGYGGQALFGYIWYTDGTWSERGEYDGSEWWEYKTSPDIPSSVFRVALTESTKLIN